MSKFNYRKALGWVLLTPLVAAIFAPLFMIFHLFGWFWSAVGIVIIASAFYGSHLIEKP